MKVAVVQMPMSWTTIENSKVIVDVIRHYHSCADILLFPELAITGFHRNVVKECQPKWVEAAMARVKAECQCYGVAVGLGYPRHQLGNYYNSFLLIDQQGNEITHWDKVGLTDSEHRFFTPGSDKPTADFYGYKVSTMLCREADDTVMLESELGDKNLDVLFWPSYIDLKRTQTQSGFIANATKTARSLECYVIQCNWPKLLNEVGDKKVMGESVIIHPTGEVIARMPANQTCVSVFDIETNQYTELPLGSMNVTVTDSTT